MKLTIDMPKDLYVNILEDNLSMREMQIILSCIKRCSTNNEIQLGDVLKYKNEMDDETALEFIVTYIDADGKNYDCICPDGACYEHIDVENMARTGRRVDVQRLYELIGGKADETN